MIEQFHLFRTHTDTIILHNNLQHPFFSRTSDPDIYFIHTCISRKSMYQCIFQKRLNHQFMNSIMPQTFFHINGTDKGIIESLLLQIHIFFQIFQFILNFHDFIALMNAVTQNGSKTCKHLAYGILLAIQCHPVDGIQCIIQKMWIDLRFQRFDFRILHTYQRFFFLLV